MLAEGIGDVLTPLKDIPQCVFVLVKPPFSVSTAEVYNRISSQPVKEHPDTKGCIEALNAGDLKGIGIRLFNVLESVTVSRHPIICQLKDVILSSGALGACMSGSGPTVFGLFDNNELAQIAYEKLKAHYDDVYICKPAKPNRGVDELEQ